MQHRSPARFLAPVAVVVAATSVYLVVETGLRSESSGSPTTTTVTTSSKKQAAERRSTYTVRRGDTLSAISERTGITLDRLERLNPQIDVNSLRAGQKIRLRQKKSS